jgi:hypothetical protein
VIDIEGPLAESCGGESTAMNTRDWVIGTPLKVFRAIRKCADHLDLRMLGSNLRS